ncbi:MAG: Na+/H+ antiporter NhaA [Sulfurovum sp.]|nr:Na+/H+ antiporter NhaA [Sulfurovum sp.]
MKIYAPWQQKFEKLSTPFDEFLNAQMTTGIILIFMTVLALVLANSALSEAYTHFFHTKMSVSLGSWEISHSIHHWINDALMAIFFFLIGLEIKREVSVGELSDLKVAILPILAAIGGMIFPALIYYYINTGGVGQSGWGIPMATDIAFAISALVLLGKRVPPALVTFLVALAIVDDLGAVLVIALFYTEQIQMVPLAWAGVTIAVMVMMNRFGIHNNIPYFIGGVILWLFMLQSGVHATIAGVIAALTIPAMPKKDPSHLRGELKVLLDEFDTHPIKDNYMMNDRQKSILTEVKEKIAHVETPAARLEHSLHLPVSLIIIPLFALANAGIALDFSTMGTTIMEPVSLGIVAGLIIGKVVGIFGVAWLAIKLGIATLPQNSTMNQIFGVAFLGGIGFTMSIFVADLAFLNTPELVFQAKVGILAASLFAGLFGYFWLRFVAKSES